MIIGLILWCGSSMLLAQTPDYKVVFDLTSKDSNDHQMVIRWLKGISQSDPAARMEVVFYAKSLDMVIKDRSTVAADVVKLARNNNISFKVCAVAMKSQKVDVSQLLPGVQTVPDGIYEIITKQKEGWGYIKASH
jgi:hypothetical protein